MDALRVSLLIIGIAIIVAIYIFGRRHMEADDRRLQLLSSFSWSGLLARIRHRIKMPQIKLPKPDLSGLSGDAGTTQSPVMPELETEDIDSLNHIVTDRNRNIEVDDVSVIVELTTEQIAPAGEQLFIPVTVLGRSGRPFTSESIMSAAQTLGMELGDDGVFRYATEDGRGYRQALLGLANILEPGTFDASIMHSFETPGLVLYLHLPGPLEAREAFDKLIDVGRALAEQLDGELCDETRSVLTNQTIGHLKEKVEAYRFKQKMTQLKQHRP